MTLSTVSNLDLISEITNTPYIRRDLRNHISNWLTQYQEKHHDLPSADSEKIIKWNQELQKPTSQKSVFKLAERQELKSVLKQCDVVFTMALAPHVKLNAEYKEDLSFDAWMNEMRIYLEEYLEFESIDWDKVTQVLKKSVSSDATFDFKGFDSVEDLEVLLTCSSSWHYLKEHKSQPKELRDLQTILAVDVVQDEESRREREESQFRDILKLLLS